MRAECTLQCKICISIDQNYVDKHNVSQNFLKFFKRFRDYTWKVAIKKGSGFLFF